MNKIGYIENIKNSDHFEAVVYIRNGLDYVKKKNSLSFVNTHFT